jgi:SAM-dependent methyltransferase
LDEDKIQDYWNKNIGKYAGFYDRGSEESLVGPRALTYAYRKLVFPIEQRVTRERFEITKRFLAAHVTPGCSVVDIGCGSGVFSKLAVELGANVLSLDFAASALELTRGKLDDEQAKRVQLRLFDVMKEKAPQSDVCLTIGVLPYISDLRPYFENVLPYAKKVLFNYLEAGNGFNRVRRAIPILNVRHYSYHRRHSIESALTAYGFGHEFAQLSTGHMVTAIRRGLDS